VRNDLQNISQSRYLVNCDNHQVEESFNMTLESLIKDMKGLLTSLTGDLHKAEHGNKAAAQRVRTGTVKLEKTAKKFRKESIVSERKGLFDKAKKAAKAAKKTGKKKSSTVHAAKAPKAAKAKKAAKKAKPAKKAHKPAAKKATKSVKAKPAKKAAPKKSAKKKAAPKKATARVKTSAAKKISRPRSLRVKKATAKLPQKRMGW